MMRRTLVGFVTVVTLAIVPVSGAAEPARSGTLIPNPSSTYNELTGVSATSTDDAWAVGCYADDVTSDYHGFVLRWDGASWSQVEVPGLDSMPSRLGGVTAISSTDVWAVGSALDEVTDAERALTIHWDGTSWSQVPTPDQGASLVGVSAVSSTDVWAVGSYRIPIRPWNRPLILHWDGTTWSQAENPSRVPRHVAVHSVSADAHRDAWVVGSSWTTELDRTLSFHWDGTSWSKIDSPNPSSWHTNGLSGVSAFSPGDVWAVGDFVDESRGRSRLESLLLHWDGHHWAQAETEIQGRDTLTAVGGTRARNVWAVGGIGGLRRQTLILHWDGTGWSQLESPNPSASWSKLNAVAASSDTDAWAVGDYVDGSVKSLIVHWDGTSWSHVT